MTTRDGSRQVLEQASEFLARDPQRDRRPFEETHRPRRALEARGERDLRFVTHVAFPNSLSRSVHVRRASVQGALKGIERALSDARAPVQRTDNRLEFSTGSLAARSGWHVLAPISDGVVEVAAAHDGVRVSYRVTFTRLVWFASFGIALVFGPLLLASPNLSIAEALGLLLLLWTVGVGGNHVITSSRFPEFLARAAHRPGPARKSDPSCC